MKIDQPGIYTMSAADYHAIETPTPVLSASIARRLLGASPLHAWYDHHALNPAGVREQKEEFDLGTAAHAYLLEGDASNFAIIDAKDWRTKKAQEERDEARSYGKTPLLTDQWKRLQAMTSAVSERLSAFSPIPFIDGRPEQTLVWREGDTWAKARLDWVAPDYSIVDDLKSTESANPDTWTRLLFAFSYDVQAAWYLRGIKALTGVEAEFRFIVCETRPPYAVSVIGLAPNALALAEKKIRRALDLWRECVTTGDWPGYPNRTCYAELPAYLEAQWLERELRDDQFKDDGRPIGDLLAGDRA